MSGTYWGNLPPPKIVRGDSLRREREMAVPEGRNDPRGAPIKQNRPPKQDLDAISPVGRNDQQVEAGNRGDRSSSQSQFPSSHRRSRYRDSIQTEAPTVSTQSPFASPTDSSFGRGGLAPRPPSFPYEATEPASNEFSEKRRRRESRNKDQPYEGNGSAAPPPAAPDVPRAPPVSYKQPYSSGPPNRTRSNRRSEGPISSSQGVAAEYYARRGSVGNGKSHSRPDDLEWDPQIPERIDASHHRNRQGSLGAEGDTKQRREWAPDRSPLQRLEITLDSITKEEKRARVEEAERLAKAARNGEKPKQNSVRFRNRPVAKGTETTTKREPEEMGGGSPARDLGTRQKDTALVQRRNTLEKQRPAPSNLPKGPVQVFDYQDPDEAEYFSRRDRNVVPDWGQSTRDRSSIPVGAAGAAAATKLGRSPSNKLKKDPPGDPWLHRRVDAEAKYQDIAQPRPSVSNQQDRGISRDVTERKNRQNSVDRDVDVSPVSPVEQSREINYDSEEDTNAKPARRLSKIERLTGQRLPSEVLRPQPQNVQATETVKVNGTKYGLPFTKSENNSRNVASQEGGHHIHNLVPHRHEDVPGQGVYVPSRRLDEWKKGAVAQLSGSLLNLEADEQMELEKDKAWWEAGNTTKRRRSTTTKQRRAEAYDGEYDDSSGTEFQSPILENGCEGCAAEARGHGSMRKVMTLINPRSRHYLGYDRKGKNMQGAASSEALNVPNPEAANLLQVPSQLPASKSNPDFSLKHVPSSHHIEHSLTCPTRAIRVRPDIAPTRFKPPLFLKAGPSLRYCGLRREPAPSRSVQALTGIRNEREIWRGSVMIVTQDEHSSYELAPTLRLFLQPMDLLPPPPSQVDGEGLAPEYVDPLAGLPKVGRDGRTLFVRPVEDLEEGKDLSKLESNEGLFEAERSNFDGASERKCSKPHYDGEKAGKYKEVRGFRLHTEHGATFWRFNLEIELRNKQQRIAYRINRGPATGFWVPARGEAMNIMFHSCNGFSYGTDPNPFNGPDPLWRDVLNNHQTQPFHVMLGGGDQIYNDAIMEETVLFKEWTRIKDPHHKEQVPFTPELQQEIESFYMNRYCMWFSQGLFGLAISQIPMINIYDDHDIIDGYGSYPDRYMRSPVMRGLGAIAFKYYMLFQHQSSIDEGEETEPQWILGESPGPYMGEVSRSIFTQLGRSIAFLGLDCRTERMDDEIVSAETYHKVFDRLERDIIKGETQHLIVLLGVPVAYPRMVWLENILTSKAMNPIKALGRAGLLGKNLLNHLDGGVEILDDLDDHWTAKHHKEERNFFIQELQDLAAEKSVRVTILGGDVHLGAIGQFYSNPKYGLAKDKDHRYMPNIISSAIVNAPPPDTLADVLNKRNKVHHLDADTDEDMIPIFTHDVTGKPRNNKCLLNRRNWCSIKMYDPELSPPPTPQTDGSGTPPPPRGGLLRRLSTSKNRDLGPRYRPDASAPPLSSPGFFNRRPSIARRGSTDSQRPGMLSRTLSLTRGSSLFRRNSKRKPDSGGINGYGSDSDSYDDEYDDEPSEPRRVGLRGGAGSPDQDSYFPRMDQPSGRDPENPVQRASTSIAGATPQKGFNKRQFHRTPTGLSQKQRKAGNVQVNLENGLDICLNVEVSPKDPAGITMPYRLLVPALWYVEEIEGEAAAKVQGNLARWISFARKKNGS
ncbi:Metallo-dependent phosphatase [Glarea lozoyensis ATCC 20868]|uniref:Metallo-dependent phosphatase n=1 Tax=Glarea lozoyensis (strain ATCC 20868 / MF5171) TaxID=1116229 RepID=S3CGY0_GLAL2|nr:Metallo-dependent phosphatase [Glarea lozoyensis ATCC 20868]EPE24549.1 Metallo-dependent phosphatase [Glarea lozoyensis ATCC 20868]